jgi:hypothetical protein
MTDEAPRDVLALREYARMSAHIAAFGPARRDAVLQKLGVSPALAKASDGYWLARLSADADDPSAPVARAFARPFIAERDRLIADAVEIETIEPIVEVVAQKAPFVPRDETAFAPAVRIDDATLPFVPAAGDQRPPPAGPQTAEDAGATGVLPVVSERPPSLPFPAPPRAHETLRAGFPLVRWASLSAELLHRPQDSASVLARYHLFGEPEYARLKQAWDDHLARSPAERAEWQRLVATYRGILAGRSG